MISDSAVSKRALQLLAIGGLLTAALLSRSGQSQLAPAHDPPGWRAFGAIHPRLAPDGKDVVFSYHGSIWRMPVEGGTMRRLAHVLGFTFEPCWSADGKRIAFLHGRGWGSGQLKMIDAQTGAALALPLAVYGTGKLAFSPDGSQILGYLRTDKQLEALRSLDLKSGEMKTVLRLRSRVPPWSLSSDGKTIAFATSMDQPNEQGGNDGPQTEVWKLGVNGGEPERVVLHPARIHDLCWSADGKALFVSSELGGAHNDLYRIDLHDAERPVQLTSGQADEDRPSAAHDGRWLLHTDNREGATALVVRDLHRGETRTLTVKRLDFGVPTGRLRINVQGAKGGPPAAARVALQEKGGGFHAPPGALWRVLGDQGHFYVEGMEEIELPAGSYRMEAVQGPECRVQRLEIDVRAGQTTEQAVAPERWVDGNAQGWFSGDNHIHANYGYGEYYTTPAHLARMCAAEGLNVCNLMVANSDGDGVFDRAFFRGRPDPWSTSCTILYWNEEFRSTIWGHLTLINLKQVVEPVFTGFKDTTNPWDVPNIGEIADRTRLQGGLVNYTHPSARIDDLYRGAYTAKGLPIYAALGKIDTVDAMGSNDQASTALYHRLLNCGLRLTASAGTDSFINRLRSSSRPGAERVYVKIDGALTYAKWIEGLRAGRSFVSNGPLVMLAVEGKEVGGTVALNAPAAVKVQATVLAQYPLDKIEVLYNGQVAASSASAKEGVKTERSWTIKVDRSGWIGMRVTGPHPDLKGAAVFAVTSPVYVTVAGKPGGSAGDAQYFLDWIDRLWQTVQERDRIPSAKLKAEVQAQVESARAVYRKIIEQAR